MRHDEAFKAIFSHRIAVEHLLRFLAGMIDDGPQWIAAFDPETLEPVPTERIDETLHRHLSDLVWRVRLRDGGEEDWAYLFVLIELQSTVDHLMAFRVRTYVDLLYRGLLAGRRFGASDRLPPVLPVVLYNGKSPWSAAASVEELVAPRVRPSIPVAPVPFYAGATYVTLDVGRVEAGDSPPDDVLSLVIGIERMSSYGEGYATLREGYPSCVVPSTGSCGGLFILGSRCLPGRAPEALQSRSSRRWNGSLQKERCGRRSRIACAHGRRPNASRDVRRAPRRASSKNVPCYDVLSNESSARTPPGALPPYWPGSGSRNDWLTSASGSSTAPRATS